MKKILSTCVALLLLVACSKPIASLDGDYKMLDAPDNAEITLRFEGNKFSGQAAINRYFGTFEKEGNKLKFGPAGATMMAGPENLMDIERQYLQNLDKIGHYSLKDKTLTLTGSDGINLTFEKQ